MIIVTLTNGILLKETTEDEDHVLVNTNGTIDFWVGGRLLYRNQCDKPIAELMVCELADLMNELGSYQSIARKVKG